MDDNMKWHGCYDDSWQGIIVPEAFSHPAKMAYGLTNRIFKHALSEGWIKPGDVVVDPFGGIGSTGIVGGCFGLKVVCVELEARFVDLARQNFERNRKYIDGFKHFGKSYHPIIIQGDSRRLSEILSEADIVVGSPPYWKTKIGGNNPEVERNRVANKIKSGEIEATTAKKYSNHSQDIAPIYGQTPGQLGSMKPGSIADVIISSPPYAEEQQGGGIAKSVRGESDYPVWDGPARTKKAARAAKGFGYTGQSTTPGNLGNLKPGSVDAVVSSPPYATGSIAKNSSGIDRQKQWETYRNQGGGLSYEAFAEQQDKHSKEYGNSQGQLQNLKPGHIDCVVSSPPYEECQLNKVDTNPERMMGGKCAPTSHGGGKVIYDHQGSKNNLGNESGQTFWQAASIIISECHKILKPGGYAIWVVKSFVRKGKIVDFPGDWQRLCESSGFETVHVHHAMLVKETNHKGLFGTITEKKERKSFFRRLAEKKGSPRIDYEVVLCTRRTF